VTISSTDPFPLLEELLGPAPADQSGDDGRASGYEAGLFEGRERARAEYSQRIGSLLAVIDERVEAAVTQVTASWTRTAADAVELGLAVAEAILGRELLVAADPGRDALERALRVTPPLDGVIRVHLHPEDADLLDLDRLPFADARSVVVVPDPTLGRGDCRVATEQGDVDATVAAALDRVRAVLGGAEG
jgi:flagellar assembly protein FliH